MGIIRRACEGGTPENKGGGSAGWNGEKIGGGNWECGAKRFGCGQTHPERANFCSDKKGLNRKKQKTSQACSGAPPRSVCWSVGPAR